MRLIALSLLLCVTGGVGASAAETETLRPLEINLRRLYPALDPRWERLETSGSRRAGARCHPEAGFLAAPAVGPRAPAQAPTALAAAARAGGGRLAASAGKGLTPRRERPGTWTVRGGPKGRYTVELGFDPAGLVYPVLVR